MALPTQVVSSLGVDTVTLGRPNKRFQRTATAESAAAPLHTATMSPNEKEQSKQLYFVLSWLLVACLVLLLLDVAWVTGR